MEQIIEILQQVRGDIDFSKEKSLIDDGIMDSFDVVGVISGLTAAFGISIGIDDMVPENFNSAEAIYALVQRKLDGE